MTKLSTLSVVLGLIMGVPGVVGVWRPASLATALRKFPRSTGIGYVLMMVGTFWFLYNLRHESIADFEPLKPALYLLFLAVGVGTCIFVKDFLAVRGMAVVLLLAANLFLDSARWVQSDWRLVIVILAYIWIVAGMWFTVSPWRARDLIYWKTATPQRLRTLSFVRLVLAALILFLGLKVF